MSCLQLLQRCSQKRYLRRRHVTAASQRPQFIAHNERRERRGRPRDRLPVGHTPQNRVPAARDATSGAVNGLPRRGRDERYPTDGLPQPVDAVVVRRLTVALHSSVHLVVADHVRVAGRPGATGARDHVVGARRIGVPVDRGAVDPGRRRLDRRRGRVQRVDEADPADARLGVGPALYVGAAVGPGDPAPAAEKAAA